MARVLSAKITGDAKIKANFGYLLANFPDWVDSANEATAAEIRDEAKRNVRQIDAFDTGELYDSIEYSVSRLGHRVEVYSTSKHAPFIEFGTAPHFPPVAAIRAWCVRKGIPESAAFPIARAISERGTPERPWLYPAFKVGMRRHVDRIRDFVGTELRKLLA
jgi:Bacteriophage HK97-gp10, putative tail-component